MANPIVTVNVNVQVAPAPSTLQKKGAIISQGATNTSPGTMSLLTQDSDLTPLLAGSKALTSLVWSGGVVTATTTTPHGLPPADVLPLTIAGAAPAGYNGTFNCTITGNSTFTYPLASNPGSETTPGVVTEEDVAELTAQVGTFFDQGSAQSATVLELGPGNATDGVAFLTAWIAANPNVFYSYLVPRFWDGNAAFLTMLGQFNSTGKKTYFFITTSLQNYGLYTAVMKCAVLLIEAPQYGAWPANVITGITQTAGVATALTTTNHGVLPGQYFQLAGNTPAAYNGWFLALAGTATNSLIFNVPAGTTSPASVDGTLVQSQYASAGIPSSEFSIAAMWWVTLNYRPTSTNKVTQLNQAFVSAVTPFPTSSNAALLTTLNAANISIIGTGAAGGISGTLVQGGNTQDGNPFKYWYSIDWTQINLTLGLNAACINGANNPQNPLDYNQPGINTLQRAAITVMSTGIGNGLVLNPIKATTLDADDFQTALDEDSFSGLTVVNADPLASYLAENPNDYAAEVYNGISADYTPLRGFGSITVNVNVSNFGA